jgi:hypothetical protein
MREPDTTTTWDQDGAGGDETEIVEPLTQVEPGFAWSDEPAETKPEEPLEVKPKTVKPKTPKVVHYTWSHTWARAMVVLASFVLVASAVGMVGWLTLHDGSITSPTPSSASPTATVTAAAPPPPPAATVTVTPPPAPAPPPVTVTAQPPKEARPSVPQSASTRDKDAAFLFQLNQGGIIVANTQQAIAGAHQYCSDSAAGKSDYDSVQEAMRNNPTLTLDNAWTYVIAAHTAYCPELGR